MKDLLHVLEDDAIRKTEHYSLIDDPSLKGMPKELVPECFNLWRRVMLTALLTVTLCADIFRDSFSASIFREGHWFRVM